VASGDDDGVGAPWMIGERVPGEALPRRLLTDDEFAAARPRLAGECGGALAAVHRIDPASVDGLAPPADPIDGLRGVLDLVSGPRPALELALRRLELEPPPDRPVSVVHGDFRTGNLLVGPDGLTAVLDWELAHLGNPVEDLGWFCVRAWRFGSPHRAGGFGSAEDLLAAYHQESGTDVSLAELAWWELYGTVRWGVICAVQAQAHLSGASRSVELATIGRRACENEYDALRLLGLDVPAPDATSAPAGSRLPGATVHDRPTAAELVDAVREFLDDDVRDATTGRVRFHARVAANALAMVERELAAGPAPAAAHAERLSELGVDDDAGLVAAIRAGDLDGDWLDVGAAVAATVAAKLAVANPRYTAR